MVVQLCHKNTSRVHTCNWDEMKKSDVRCGLTCGLQSGCVVRSSTAANRSHLASKNNNNFWRFNPEMQRITFDRSKFKKEDSCYGVWRHVRVRWQVSSTCCCWCCCLVLVAWLVLVLRFNFQGSETNKYILHKVNLKAPQSKKSFNQEGGWGREGGQGLSYYMTLPDCTLS